MPIDGPRKDAPRDALTSTVLEQLLSDLPTDFVTLGWFMSRLGERSFGMVLLLLGMCGTLPVISPAAALLISIPALQMIRGPASTQHSAASRPVPDQKYCPGFRAAAGDPSTS